MDLRSVFEPSRSLAPDRVLHRIMVGRSAEACTGATPRRGVKTAFGKGAWIDPPTDRPVD
jgi:hypothetical protein